jgi:predicted peroxiredoxin
MGLAAPRLAVHLLHSSDEPDRVVAALRVVRAAAIGAAPTVGAPALVLDLEGVRLAAKGVAAALNGDGRPDVKALLESAVRAGAKVFVDLEAWRARGYLDDALVEGASLADAGMVANLVATGHVFVGY